MKVHRTVEEGSSRERGWRRWGAASVLGPLALSLALASPADAYVDSQYPCDPQGAGFSQSARKTLAQRCIDDRHGKIALVGYDVDSIRLSDIATRAEKFLRQATNNLISPDVIPMVASPAAAAQFHLTNPFCVDTANIHTAGAETADELMGLKDQDFVHVFAVTGLPDCDDAHSVASVEGIAWGDDGWRYSELLSANKPDITKDPDRLLETFSHEVGHMEGYGHAGALIGQDKLMTLYHFKTYPNLSNDTEIDLNQVIATYPADEYGSQSNIMGGNLFDNNGAGFYLNGLQRKRLRWAETVLEPKSATSVRGDFLDQINGSGWVSIAKPTSADHGFGVMNLDDIVTLHDSNGKLLTDPSFQFNRLVVEPVYDKQGYLSNFIEVYLATDDPHGTLATMSLGFLDLSKPEKSNRTLELNGQKIRIRATTDGGFVVSDETSDVRVEAKRMLQQLPR